MVYKCKMCGGQLSPEENASVVECLYCGTRQTISKTKNEKNQGLIFRANNLRLKNDFDKAAELYEKALQTENDDSEVYWGLVLCKYGIEYVEDPNSGKRIPTCHRAQYESIMADAEYQEALKYADTQQRAVYEKEAKAIAELQHDILEIVQKEQPYDVFICYKETDANKNRTEDSVLAEQIYEQLTREGYRVFFSRVTLEAHLGRKYEPYIFSALNSAKVMLVVGTKPEHFTAVWVRNEWSRFLKILAKDRNKLLIPCFRDMDAYDLPVEFRHMEAQDMNKIGFVKILLQNIARVLGKKEPGLKTGREAGPAAVDNRIAPLIKRAYMFLSDGDWDKALQYAERILDVEPECTDAYLIRLLGKKQLHSLEDQVDELVGIEEDADYNKALRFADDERKKQLLAIKQKADYEFLVKALAVAIQEKDLKIVVSCERLFREMGDYRDAQEYAEKSLITKRVLEEFYIEQGFAQMGEKRNDSFELFCKIAEGNSQSIDAWIGIWMTAYSEEDIAQAYDGVKSLAETISEEECKLLEKIDQILYLSRAAEAQDDSRVRYVIEHYPQILNVLYHFSDADQMTPFHHVSCMVQNCKYVRWMLEHGADTQVVRTRTKEDKSEVTFCLLEDVIGIEDEELLKVMLEGGADPNIDVDYVDEEDHWKIPFLFSAVIGTKDVRLIELLLAKGASPNHSLRGIMKKKEIPMIMELVGGEVPIESMELLMQHGMDVNAIAPHKIGVSYYERHPLTEAIEYSDAAMVKLLIKYGAVTNYKDAVKSEKGAMWYLSPLGFAIVSYLEQNGPARDLQEIIKFLAAQEYAMDEKISIGGTETSIRKFPFGKHFNCGEKCLDFLKTVGWKPSWWNR